MYSYYFDKVKYQKYLEVSYKSSNAVAREAGIKDVAFKFVNKEDSKFFSTTEYEMKKGDDVKNGFSLTCLGKANIDTTQFTAGKKVVPMQLIITDEWGKVMTYEFEVEISL